MTVQRYMGSDISDNEWGRHSMQCLCLQIRMPKYLSILNFDSGVLVFSWLTETWKMAAEKLDLYRWDRFSKPRVYSRAQVTSIDSILDLDLTLTYDCF